MAQPEGRPTPVQIREMVEAFYVQVRTDPLLGPVFAQRITDWSPHLDRMTAFWSGILLAQGGYIGDPIGKHRAIAELEPAHFDRWLELFHAVVSEQFDPGMAANIYGRALRMRVVLERNGAVSGPQRPYGA